MPEPFRVLPTPGFQRDVRHVTRRNSALLEEIERLIAILREDPHNRTRQHPIKKLSGVKPRQGQWRIRSGDYRLRYDIFGHDVVLYAIRSRTEAY